MVGCRIAYAATFRLEETWLFSLSFCSLAGAKVPLPEESGVAAALPRLRKLSMMPLIYERRTSEISFGYLGCYSFSQTGKQVDEAQLT
jgi:hypothetical protein